MAQIEQASKKISDITVVIDDIAFQTNLLALTRRSRPPELGMPVKGLL